MQFKLDVKNLYNVGTKSFLSEKNEGDCETFYCHVLYAYMPMIVDDTWNKFQLGCGIFNMQGFERRNKESKEIFSKFINGKDNVVKQSLKRLYKKHNSWIYMINYLNVDWPPLSYLLLILTKSIANSQ